MRTRWFFASIMLFGVLWFAQALADKYTDTIDVFKKAGQSATFFDSELRLRDLPAIGKGGIGIGGARTARVTSMRRASTSAMPR